MKTVQQRYVSDGCSNSAAALTYMSLFALVPLITVMYRVLLTIPASQEAGTQIQEFIFSNFVPSSGQEIQSYLQQFSQQAQTLTGIGIVFLVTTAFLMLKNIEKTFNAIWRTHENRHGISSFLLYWAILSLGPIFIGLAFGISTYLASLKLLFDQVDVIGIGPQLLSLTPYILMSAAFTLLFVAVPNCKVPIKHAVIGGLVTAFAFEMAKQIFTGVVSNSSFQHIYGTFAAIPLFLFWIYLSWLIILAGGELVNALSGFQNCSDEDYSDLTIALGILELLWQRHLKGRTLEERELLHRPWLFGRHSISAERWTRLRDFFLQGDLIRIAKSGDFVLGRDLSKFTLWDLTVLLDKNAFSANSSESNMPAWYRQYQKTMGDLEHKNQQTLATTLTDFFDLATHKLESSNKT